MKVFSKTTLFLFTILMIFSMLEGATANMKESQLHLPKKIGVWTRSDSAQMIDATNIFEYMNGAGELYLGYRFDHLEVYEYIADEQAEILVELYVMDSSDDAFGLLSLDWGGEPVALSNSPEPQTIPPIAPSSRALYGGGLLRLCSDTLYARIMAYRETPESKDAVLALGRAIVANRANSPEPEVVQMLPQAVGSDWTLRRDRIGYFRSHLVLNSLYYLSHQNILNLDHSTEAVIAPYENLPDPEERTRVQLLFVKYAHSERAQQALEHFHTTYLTEQAQDFVTDSMIEGSNFFSIEDGWVGYALSGACLALVFECPDRESAQMIINHIQFECMAKGE